MAEKTNVPEIRFAGFTDPWEQRKLGELMDVASVRRVHQEDWTDEGVRFLRARDLVAFAKNESIEDPLFISSEMYKEYSAQSGKVSVGDLLVTGVGTIGVPWLVTSDNPVYFKDGNIIWFKNRHSIDGGFFYHSFTASAIQNYINEAAGIGTVGTYTIETGKKTPIWLPSRQEQREIAAMMTHLDTLITLHQRKYDKLAQLKKSMLDKMFPKPGERFPEIRFAGFTDPWEQRKFSDVVDVCSGKDYKHLKEGPIPVYGTGGFMTSVDEALSYDRDAVGIGRKGTIDKPYLLKAPFWTVDTLFYAIPKSDIDLEFVHCSFLNVDWKSKDESTGLPSLSKEAINETIALVPSFNEQSQLGEFFYNLDSLITLHQRMGPIFCFCAHGSRTNFASTLQG